MTKNIRVAVAAALVAGVLALTGVRPATKDGAEHRRRWSASPSSRAPTRTCSRPSRRPTTARESTFKTSYGASGDQSRAVAGGQSADFVHFSLETDVTRLVDEGMVADDWNHDDTKGMLTSSVVVFVVRPGNPETSRRGRTSSSPASRSSPRTPPRPVPPAGTSSPAGATRSPTVAPRPRPRRTPPSLSRTPSSCPGPAATPPRRSSTAAGDVLLSYENEAILARQHGQDVDYVIPPETLLIENTGAVTEDADDAAQNFFDFLHSEEARPSTPRPASARSFDVDTEVEGANDPADPFPAPEKLLTIDRRLRWLVRGGDEVLRDGGEPLGSRSSSGRRQGRRVTSALAPPVGRPTRTRRPVGGNTLTPSSALALGIAVHLVQPAGPAPPPAIVAVAAAGGWEQFWR